MNANLPRTRRARLITAGTVGVLAAALVGTAVLPGVAAASSQQAIADHTEAPLAEAVVAYQAVLEAEILAAEEAARQAAEEERARIEAERAALEVRLAGVVNRANSRLGHSYVSGGSGPSVFDCSGLTRWTYQQEFGINLPHNTHAQWNAIDNTWYAGEKQPLPGDLVFFFNNGADHVGIYVGDGMMVHAANPRTGVTKDSIYSGYWGNKLTGFGRPAV